MLDSLDAVEAKPVASPDQETKPPQREPTVYVSGISMGGHTVAFGDGRRDGVPQKDAVRLELFVAIHDAREHAPLDRARYFRSFVKSPIEFRFDASADKRTATYYGRWANERGDVGPWSSPVSMTIAAPF